MKGDIMKTFALSLAILAFAGAAQARTNIETSAIDTLRQRGVPEACLARVTLSDAARIRSIEDSADATEGHKNWRLREIGREICAR